jgi:hypothetical protein
MNLKNILLLILILILTDCNLIKHSKSPVAVVKDNSIPEKPKTPVVEDKILFHAKFSSIDSNKIERFECEEFVSNALNNYTIAKINKEFLTSLVCTKKSIFNRHDPAVVDTIYTFSNPENNIQFYRAKQNDFIFTFDVTDSKFILKGNVKPGITKDFFMRKFQITEAIDNKVQIVNSEGTMRFIFYFENNMLKRISSYLYLD